MNKTFTTLALTTLVTLIPFTTNAYAAELQNYQRKYISFFEDQSTNLDELVIKGLELSLPRFDYHSLNMGNINFLSFLRSVKLYQKQHAGELASKNEKENVKFKDKVISLSQTNLIANSAYVFVPKLKFDDYSFSVSEKEDKDGSKKTTLTASSSLACTLSIYKIVDEPYLYSEVHGSWSLKEEFEYSGTKKSNEETIENKKKEIRKVSSTYYFHDKAVTELSDDIDGIKGGYAPSGGFGDLIQSIRNLDDFIIKAQIEDSNYFESKISFGDTEDTKTLGIRLDNGYKVYEEKNGENVEIGYMKIRDMQDKFAFAQPIIADREFEMGDQIKEYPKQGISLGLKLGYHNYIHEKSLYNGNLPTLALDFESNIAGAIGISELYGAFDFFGAFPPITAGYIPFGGEIGLVKKWYMRQFIIVADIRAGGLMGVIPNFEEDKKTETTDLSLGFTGLLGLHYQISPDTIWGLDLGYKSYEIGETTAMKSKGLVVNLFANYEF